ncbi:F-box/kelch-repeat protein At1g57790-like [Coffea arabica]|uniref:F-box/kelch-repeat protein At1g57790-like n=1 Tax=Coffea arabica TaxID=13443 RepID=A0ABM4U1P4_COFAR
MPGVSETCVEHGNRSLIPSNNPQSDSRCLSQQWLMHKDLSRGTCKFSHPVYRDAFCLGSPELPGHSQPSHQPPPGGDAVISSVLRFSKGGWLLMSKGRFSVFFYNPFTKAKMYLPLVPDPERYVLRGITFLSTPASPDCLVLGLSALFYRHVAISIIRRGEKHWNFYRFENNLPIIPSYCNPVFHKGMFYCLGEGGNLGVFSPDDNQWTVLVKPQKIYKRGHESYLLEIDGELISVFVQRLGSQISVFRLDETKMAWEEVSDLGDNMVFISPTNSFSRKKVIEGMHNKIYFSRLHKGCCVFYSLDTKKFHTLLKDFSSASLCNTPEQLRSCWIEPTADHHITEEQLNW